jgi:putative ABC transport system substrate-binding protein
MRRREFISFLGGAAATWPFVVRAQQAERVRRIGVLLPNNSDDPQGQARLAAFVKELQHLGWTNGSNVQIETRWGGADAGRYRKYAAELVALSPDVILANTSPIVAAVQEATQTIPIVFVQVIDPVGAGFVTSLAKPGSNATGFALFEFGLSGKWLALLKEIVPGITRAAVLRNPSTAAGVGQLGAIQAVAPSLGVELTPIDARSLTELERGITEFSRAPNGGLVVAASPIAQVHRQQLIALVARLRLPAVYPFRYFAAGGALISYGPNLEAEQNFVPAAGYVDRVLRGERPADLPVQAPDKYELVVNLRTAKALGLTIPPSVLSRADEVIE